MNRTACRASSIEAGAIAGIAGLAVFLVLHHVWIAPIWFVAPVGAVLATSGGAAVVGVLVDIERLVAADDVSAAELGDQGGLDVSLALVFS